MAKQVIEGLQSWTRAAQEQGYTVTGPHGAGMYQAYSKTGAHQGTFCPTGFPAAGSLWGKSRDAGVPVNSGVLYTKTK